MAALTAAALPDASRQLAIDARSLDAIKQGAGQNQDAALRAAARQFEAVFMRMLMSSMRQSLPGDDLMGSSASKMATGMLDDQWAQVLTAGSVGGSAGTAGAGKGLGLADMMLRQIEAGRGHGQRGAGQGMLDKIKAATSAIEGGGQGAQPLRRAASQAAPVAVPAPATPAATNPGPSAAAAAPGSPQEFVQRLMGDAVKAQESSGIPASFILGQAALESGWGKREIKAADGTPSHNLFGIKAGRSWSGPTVDAVTTEYVNGVPRRSVEKFRAYGSYAEAFADYANTLSRNPRYARAVDAANAATAAGGAGAAGSNAEGAGKVVAFAQGIQAGGYATDPDYARKLSRTINQTLALQGALA